MTQRIPVPITVAIPAIPPRVDGLLYDAVRSVKTQTVTPAGGISCALDVARQGAGVTRQRALDGVRTEWVAFLDDDDILYPRYLEKLYELAEGEGADYVWSWFDGNDPFPMHRGRQMNPADPHHTTMTVLVRTELAKSVGFRTDHPEGWTLPQEDWRFILDCVAAGAKFAHIPDVLWHYRLHGHHTSGLASRW